MNQCKTSGLECCLLIGPAFQQELRLSFKANFFKTQSQIIIFQIPFCSQKPPPSLKVHKHVRSRQGKDSQEVGVQEHQGRVAVPRGSYRPLP